MSESDVLPRWNQLTSSLVAEVRDKWWTKIAEKYSEAHRHYHTLQHIAEMFQLYDTHKDSLKNAVAVAYAILFHDLVYDPKSAENEAESVALFKDFAQEAALDQTDLVCNLISASATHCIDVHMTTEFEFVPDVVCDLISASATHCTDAHMTTDSVGSDDLHYFLDFDMAILGADADRYSEYKASIRREYAHHSDNTYNQERIKVLGLFLQIPNIFATKEFRDKYEAKARSNIKAEVDELKELSGAS